MCISHHNHLVMDHKLHDAIQDLFGTDVASAQPVSGGDINQAYRLDLSDGNSVFLKVNRPDLEDMFHAEKEGLAALAASGAIAVARPLFAGKDPEESISYLLLVCAGGKSLRIILGRFRQIPCPDASAEYGYVYTRRPVWLYPEQLYRKNSAEQYHAQFICSFLQKGAASASDTDGRSVV